MRLLQFLFEYTEHHGNALAIQNHERQLTYNQLLHAVANTAKKIQEWRLEQDARIALLSTNNMESILLLLACYWSGHSVLLLNCRLNTQVWMEQIEEANCALLITESLFDELPCEQTALKQLINIAQLVEEDCSGELLLQDFAREDAIIIYSSGSTAKAKGVVLSSTLIELAACDSNQITGLDRNDCWLLSTPLYHVAGLAIIFRCLFAGCRIFVDSKHAEEMIAQVLLSHSFITSLSTVPTVMQALLHDEPLANRLLQLKRVMLGGQQISAGLVDEIKQKKLAVYAVYGMSETFSHITYHAIQTMQTSDEAGFLMPHISARINAQGELLLKGPRLINAYLHGSSLNDGWFNTHDLAALDDEGRLSLFGRSDQVIISGGEHINLKEIELAANDFLGNKISCAIGVADAIWGQRPVLFVESADYEQQGSLQNHLARVLPRIKWPDRIIYLAVFPRTEMGKLSKAHLLDCYKQLSV